jgi:integrase
MVKAKIVVNLRNKFAMRWVDPRSGRWRERTTGLDATERYRNKAHQMLAQLQAELAGEVPPSLTISPGRQKVVEPETGRESTLDGEWVDYVEYFTKNHLSGLSKGYSNVLLPVVGKFHSFAKPRYLQDITPQTIRRWIADLQESGLAIATVHSYWGCLSAFLRIAVDDGIIKAIPKIRLPKLDRRSMSKGRAITGEEFDRMLAAVDEIAPKQAEHWKFLLQGLWNCGLRIGEAYTLSWGDSDFCIDLEQKYPCFVIAAAGQKSRRRQTLPIPPEFTEALQAVPQAQRRGKVFKFLSERGSPLGQTQVERVIAAFGRKAKIKVSKTKTATAHDLRRSFGNRWALKVMPQVLQQMMRHADIQTTMRFYVDLKAQDLGQVMYAAAAKKPAKSQSQQGGKSKPRKKPT